MADLGRWLSEDYRVPDDPAGSPDDELDDNEPDDNSGPIRSTRTDWDDLTSWPTR